MKTRALRRVLGALALPGAVLCAGAAGCEPQDIYLFDEAEGRPPAAVPDAGRDQPEPLPPSDEDSDDEPVGMQPACVTPACRQCVANADCRLESTTLYCHPLTAECKVPCEPDAVGDERACPKGEHCDASGLCVDCVLNEHCGAGPTPVCDGLQGVCVQCVGAADCPGERPICDDARCVECVDDGDCAATGEVCLPGAQRCVQCRNDADCSGGDDEVRCLPEQLLCVECLDDGDCAGDPEKPFCKLSEHECDDERS